jgi:hypothetical protein
MIHTEAMVSALGKMISKQGEQMAEVCEHQVEMSDDLNDKLNDEKEAHSATKHALEELKNERMTRKRKVMASAKKRKKVKKGKKEIDSRPLDKHGRIIYTAEEDAAECAFMIKYHEDRGDYEYAEKVRRHCEMEQAMHREKKLKEEIEECDDDDELFTSEPPSKRSKSK